MWTLEYQTQERTLAEWGLSDVKLVRQSLGMDELIFRAGVSDASEESLFAYGSTLVLKRNGVRWFVGRVQREPRMARSSAEEMSYSVVGAWWYLKQLVYQQDWKTNGEVLKKKSRIILGRDVDEQALSSAQVITDAVQYAINAGRPLALGTVEPTLMIPRDERKDITCAEVIESVCAWNPDCVVYWDYSTVPYPTLHVKRASNLSAVSLDVQESSLLQQVQVHPRYDLKRSAVVIRYERIGTTNGKAWADVVTDAYPTDAVGTEEDALVLTLGLEGSKQTVLSQQVQTRTVQESEANLTDALTYWKKLVPALNSAEVSDVQFHTLPQESVMFKRVLADTAQLDDQGQPLVLDTTLSRELVQGAVTPWMREEPDLVKAQQQVLYACMSFKKNGVAQPARVFSHTFTATNATSGTYTQLKTLEGGEPVPLGLAQALQANLNTVPYEGELSLQEQECAGTVGLGNVVNLLNGHAEWQAMRAVVQRTEEWLDAGKTVVSMGVQAQLQAQDLLALLRLTRPNVQGRVSGSSGSSKRNLSKPAQEMQLGVVPVNSYASVLPDGGAGVGVFQLQDASAEGLAKVKVSFGSVMPQAGGYASPIVPKLWNGTAWVALDADPAPVLTLPSVVGVHRVYLKAQYNFLRYVRKIGILSTASSLPAEQLPLNTYTATGEDVTGWTTSAGTPDNASDCGLSYRLIGQVEVELVESVYRLKSAIVQDVVSSLGFIPTASGQGIWYQV